MTSSLPRTEAAITAVVKQGPGAVVIGHEVLGRVVEVTSGFASTPASWRRAMALLGEGDLDLAPLLGQRIGLGDFDRALATVRSAAGLKTVVVPS